MTIERGLRLATGVVVLLSVALGYSINPAWLLLTAFAGLNLLQSALRTGARWYGFSHAWGSRLVWFVKFNI